jgi:hypothetical protein
VVAELLEAPAQAANAYVHQPRVDAAASSPHAELKKPSREHFADMPEKQMQQAAFRGSQGSALISASNGSPLIIDLQLGERIG